MMIVALLRGFRWLRSVRALPRDDEGTVFIEAAMVLPVLLTLVLGSLEFSFVFYQIDVMNSGIRDASRYLARMANPADAGAQASARHLATAGQLTGGVPRVPGWTDDDITICIAGATGGTCAAGCDDEAAVASGGNPCGTAKGCRGTVAAVEVSSRFTVRSLGFFSLLGLSPPTLCLSHQERVLPDAPSSS